MPPSARSPGRRPDGLRWGTPGRVAAGGRTLVRVDAAAPEAVLASRRARIRPSVAVGRRALLSVIGQQDLSPVRAD